ncbi:hypothetical protein BC834DRAFT_895827 [Gloeopeniophorella convolvens]|nr:hypothetical protein BC834DRAFT_895827 [Gloeopeniophorella convolvens]
MSYIPNANMQASLTSHYFRHNAHMTQPHHPLVLHAQAAPTNPPRLPTTPHGAHSPSSAQFQPGATPTGPPSHTHPARARARTCTYARAGSHATRAPGGLASTGCGRAPARACAGHLRSQARCRTAPTCRRAALRAPLASSQVVRAGCALGAARRSVAAYGAARGRAWGRARRWLCSARTPAARSCPAPPRISTRTPRASARKDAALTQLHPRKYAQSPRAARAACAATGRAPATQAVAARAARRGA